MLAPRGIEYRRDGAHRVSVGDDDVKQRILSSLRHSGYWVLSRLECDVTDGVVVLSGHVSSYFLKQVAQSLVLQQSDIRILENQIVVRWENRLDGNAQ